MLWAFAPWLCLTIEEAMQKRFIPVQKPASFHKCTNKMLFDDTKGGKLFFFFLVLSHRPKSTVLHISLEFKKKTKKTCHLLYVIKWLRVSSLRPRSAFLTYEIYLDILWKEMCFYVSEAPMCWRIYRVINKTVLSPYNRQGFALCLKYTFVPVDLFIPRYLFLFSITGFFPLFYVSEKGGEAAPITSRQRDMLPKTNLANNTSVWFKGNHRS